MVRLFNSRMKSATTWVEQIPHLLTLLKGQHVLWGMTSWVLPSQHVGVELPYINVGGLCSA